MSTDQPRPPPAHHLQPAGLVNLAAQSAEQIALAAAPIVAVIMLGVGESQTGLLQTALTLPFILFAIPAGLLGRSHLAAPADGGFGSFSRGRAGRPFCC